MKTRQLSTIFFLTLFVISGCEKVVDFDEKDVKPQLVVNCILDTDNTIKVKVTKSKSAIDETVGFETIKGATISLSDGTNTFPDFIFVEDQDTLPYYNWSTNSEFSYIIFENGYYVNPSIKVTPNKSYSMKVNAPGFDEVTSETEVLSIVPIERLDTFITQTPQQLYIVYTLNARVNFTDPQVEKNFYSIEMEKATLSLTEDYTGSHTYFFSSKLFVSPDDPVFEKESPGLFATGRSNLYSVFNDALIDGKNYSISFGIESIYSNTGFTGFPESNNWGDARNYQINVYKIDFRTISESYYKYIKTKTLQENAESDPFSDPALIYTNIENGMGIFGSSSVSSKYIMTSNFPDSLFTKLLPSHDNEGIFNFIKQENAKPSKGDYYNY
jgi:hypothetical protein